MWVWHSVAVKKFMWRRALCHKRKTYHETWGWGTGRSKGVWHPMMWVGHRRTPLVWGKRPHAPWVELRMTMGVALGGHPHNDVLVPRRWQELSPATKR